MTGLGWLRKQGTVRLQSCHPALNLTQTVRKTQITAVRRTEEANVGHEAAIVVVMRAAGDSVRRHLAVHVEISEPRPGEK